MGAPSSSRPTFDNLHMKPLALAGSYWEAETARYASLMDCSLRTYTGVRGEASTVASAGSQTTTRFRNEVPTFKVVLGRTRKRHVQHCLLATGGGGPLVRDPKGHLRVSQLAEFGL